MKYSTILVDLDGTLTDPFDGVTRSVQYALECYDIMEEDYEKLILFVGHDPVERFRSVYGFSDEDAAGAAAVYHERYAHVGINENNIYEGVEELLNGFCVYGLNIGLVTTKPKVYAEKILKQFEIETYFNAVCGSEMDGSRITKVEAINEALFKFDVDDRSQVVLIGDRVSDLEAARQAGVDAIGVVWGYGEEEDLVQHKHVFIAEDLKSLYEFLKEK